MNIKSISLLIAGIILFSSSLRLHSSEKVVVAYVTSWSNMMPDPTLVTHINYAFGHVADSFDNVRIDNLPRLKDIVAIKQDNPQLKVMLSIGGWGSGRFSEMAQDKNNRLSFARNCRMLVDSLHLNGIDIDWEYPGSSAAKISSSPDDRENFTLLMKDLRNALGDSLLLTLASDASASYIDYPSISPLVDFVNIMAYDMAVAPKHHSPLYSSPNTSSMTSDLAVKAHLSAGIPAEKLVLGMPFYGRGGSYISNFIDYNEIEKLDKTEYSEKWDETAAFHISLISTAISSADTTIRVHSR